MGNRWRPVWYLDGIARPTEPWYEIVCHIARHLLVEPFETAECHWAVTSEGWDWLVDALERYGAELSLPPGASAPLGVVPEDLRHRLNLQSCFTAPEGLGQEEVGTLQEGGELYRIKDFVERLRACPESVEHLELTLDTLLDRLVLPAVERPFFVAEMIRVLGMASTNEPLAPYLSEGVIRR